MRLIRLSVALATLLTFALAAPKPRQNGGCINKTARKPWQMLKPQEKSDYIKAELCLMSSPPKLNIPGAQNRWDELQWNHVIQTNFVHDVGAFLPWHRYYVTVHANLLRDECGYHGPIPYWDETGDADAFGDTDAFSNAAIFKPDAFGGNGVGNGTKNCIANGPFVDTTLHLPKLHQEPVDYCIYRKFNSTSIQRAKQINIDKCFAIQDYTSAWECWHKDPHNGGHSAIGGLMMDVVLSPGDPLFFLHHCWVDAMWHKWQLMDLENRLTDMGGRNILTPEYMKRFDFTYPGPEFTDYSGDPGNVTTLNHVLYMADLAPNVTIGDVMDVGGETICAEYFYNE
ncbi:amino acid transporter [Pseudomassariella vexata]|uniref:Amino acid transporter n=1 Tax=Pseudomassariella vexata TaxID=1141098 RepID=A0A1Y2DPS8_9PEZI|nr:amino acid transporter [Pseudomassariella vexata]ORY61288.1 amino acid transporter [Pseudomassariella vexata]